MNENTERNTHVKQCIQRFAGPADEGKAALLDAMLKQDFLREVMWQIVTGNALVKVEFLGRGDRDDISQDYWFDPTPGHHLATLHDLREEVLDWLPAEEAWCRFSAKLGRGNEWSYYLGEVANSAVDVDETVAALLGWTDLTVEQRLALLGNSEEPEEA